MEFYTKTAHPIYDYPVKEGIIILKTGNTYQSLPLPNTFYFIRSKFTTYKKKKEN